MPCLNCGNPDYITSTSETSQPNCEQCNNESKCVQKFDAECVVYHPDNDKASKLNCLAIPNTTNLEVILEKIDEQICNGRLIQTPLIVVDTNTVDLTSTGILGHTLSADVKLSSTPDNGVQILSDGLFSPLPDGRVKVDSTDFPDYLINQIVGGTDGIVSISVYLQDDQLVIKPTLDIDALLEKIKTTYLTKFCELRQNCIVPCPTPTNLTSTIS